ncbi:alpha-hydroxy-acid oxidizing enzyme [Pseudomonas fluorescens]|uniref:L-lactate dehydrogenase n=1 Tax=Pseudomonas fluorescens TaxID=294 RepID=A0A1T2Z6X8_PSEFL|nr:FMN-dependent L-lactate dehydrogenase LldD [Pseudomonas fluorescens]OPB00391.1 alpha-hydroxy-acid oxidizing enzyme [Pseudomonas fluorescens]
MIISSASDYREAAKRKLPRFLFDYIDGGAYAESTLRANSADLAAVRLRQRILKNVDNISLKTTLFGTEQALPIILSPVGLTGMYARRGEVQVAKAALNKGIPYCLSTVSVCSIEEVTARTAQPLWFQLYVLKDRGFMKNVLERAQAAGVTTLVFTADMPTPGARYRDAHSGMSGPFAASRRILQATTKPDWAFNVGILGRPHDLGNVSRYLGKTTSLEDYVGWLGKNFDPSISWKDLEWVREFWKGPMIIKGILDPQDAREALSFGADGIVVSNHGGRQLDGVPSTAKALPPIADAVGNNLTVLVDSGIRSGLDVVRMLALGAKAVLLGRSTVFALAAEGQRGVENMLDIFTQEMRVAMTLTGVTSIDKIDHTTLVQAEA